MNDQTAIEMLKSGNIAGLEWLVRSYQLRAIRAAYLIVGEQAAAEDVVQAAFL